MGRRRRWQQRPPLLDVGVRLVCSRCGAELLGSRKLAGTRCRLTVGCHGRVTRVDR